MAENLIDPNTWGFQDPAYWTKEGSIIKVTLPAGERWNHCWNVRVPVKTGDRVIIKAMIKTGDCYGSIGCDFRRGETVTRGIYFYQASENAHVNPRTDWTQVDSNIFSPQTMVAQPGEDTVIFWFEATKGWVWDGETNYWGEPLDQSADAWMTSPEMYIVAATPTPPPVMYPCPYCDLEFASEAELAAHISAVHFPPVQVFTCSICGAQFATQAELDAHVLAVHPAPPTPAPYTSTYIAYASGVSQRDIAVLRILGHHFLPAWVISMYDFAGASLAKLLVNKSSKKTLARFFEWIAKRGRP